MASEPEDKEFTDILNEVRREYNEYENQRVFCVAFKKHLEKTGNLLFPNEKIEFWLEPEVEPSKPRPNQSFKTPDMLIRKDSYWLVLDYKEITSKDETTLHSHLDAVGEYEQEFIFKHGSGKNGMFTEKFIPEVAIICPQEAAEEFKKYPLSSISILSSVDQSTIKLNKVIDKFSNNIWSQLFSKDMDIPKDSLALATIRFLRHRPPLSYTALHVYQTIPQADPNSYSDPIETKSSVIAEKLSGYYPSYLKTKDGYDIRQITLGIVRKAVEFLDRIGFVEVKGDEVTMKRSAGRTVGDMKEYFIRKEAEVKFREKKKIRDRQAREELRRVERETRRRARDEVKAKMRARKEKSLDYWVK